MNILCLHLESPAFLGQEQKINVICMVHFNPPVKRLLK